MYTTSVPIRDFLSVGLLTLLLVPCSASAKTTTEWSFANETLQEGWEASGNPSLAARREGLLITTNAETIFGRAIDLSHPIEVIAIGYKSDDLIEGWLYWHEPQNAPDDLTRLPLFFSPTKGIGTINIDMMKYDTWEGRADFVGIGLPKNSKVLIEDLALTSWSASEKLSEAIKSFWTFDVRKPSSINFLWGPHIAFNPLTREQMFRVTPPNAQSANWYFYLALALVTLWAFLRIRKHPDLRKKILTVVMVIVAGLWIFYDIRMGSEFFDYMKRDYRTYWSRPIGERTFRERSYFNDFATSVTPLVEDQEKYIFIATHRWPFLGLMRYYTYPNIPVDPLQAKETDTWIVYRRPDFTIDARGRLTSDGIAFSSPGKVLHEFEKGTFVFRVQ